MGKWLDGTKGLRDSLDDRTRSDWLNIQPLPMWSDAVDAMAMAMNMLKTVEKGKNTGVPTGGWPMDEREWLTSEDPWRMIDYLRMDRKYGSRKWELFEESHAVVWPEKREGKILVFDANTVGLLREIFGNPFRPVKPVQWCADGPACKAHGFPWITPVVQGIARSIYEDRSFGDMPILADALEEAGCTEAAIINHCRNEIRELFNGQYSVFYNLDNPHISSRSRKGLDISHVRGCWVLDLLLGKE